MSKIKTKNNKDNPDLKNTKPPYRTVKTSLKSILLDYDNLQPEINKLVLKCNDIVIQTYQFIRLFILNKYSKNEALPKIDKEFVSYALKIQGTRDARGKKATNATLLKELDDFYTKEFEVITKAEKFDLKNLSFVFPYIVMHIVTNYETNIKEHYLKHLIRFINKTTTDDKDKRKEIKNAVIDREEKINVPDEFKDWYTIHKDHIIPTITKSIPYDVKASPQKFIKCLIYMNSVLEASNIKLFQPLPLRNNIVPKYLNLDTACLINLFANKGKKGKLMEDVKDSKNIIWNQLFRMSKKIFRDTKDYKFNYQIQTDGIGCSLSFVRKDLFERKYGTKVDIVEDEDYKYIDDFNDEELTELNKKNVVGVDPGKRFLVYMVDDKGKTLKYSAPQKRAESMAKRNTKILLTEKKRNKVTGEETKLSEQNSKSINYDKFKQYIIEKTILNKKLRDFYVKDVWRKMKWRQYVYSRKSEDNFLNRIENTFGKDCVLAYGDWSRSTQMKHFMPTKGIGLRKIIHKRFQTISINEFNTSKKCCGCGNDLEYYNKNETIRLLSCSKCLSPEDKRLVFRTRDSNSACNIRNLFRFYCKNKSRPDAFIRASSVSTQTSSNKTVETVQSCKTGISVLNQPSEKEAGSQSVDFTGVKSPKPKLILKSSLKAKSAF